MNRVVLIGRWTRDLDLQFIPGTGTAVAKGTLAVDRRVSKDSKKEADFIQVVIWGKLAENAATYTGKGKLCSVAGRIQTKNYEAKDGTRRYVTEVVAEEVQFLEWGNNSNTSNNGSAEDYTEVPTDDRQIPF